MKYKNVEEKVKKLINESNKLLKKHTVACTHIIVLIVFIFRFYLLSPIIVFLSKAIKANTPLKLFCPQLCVYSKWTDLETALQLRDGN